MRKNVEEIKEGGYGKRGKDGMGRRGDGRRWEERWREKGEDGGEGGGGVDNSIRLVWIPRAEACCHSKLFAIHQNPDTVQQDPAACERLNKYKEQNLSTNLYFVRSYL
jgi:hypothetical protein